MIIKKIIIKEIPQELDIRGITLLSTEEYEEFQDNIPLLNRCWWLRSPGRDDFAALVDITGFVYYYGFVVFNSDVAVRPALIISNLKSSDLLIGDKFSVRGKTWTIIAETYALCDDLIGNYCLRKDWKVEDVNDYESSDIKIFIENWWKNQDSHN